MEDFGNANRFWFERHFALKNGIPSHDTFRRVFSLVDAREFETAFIQWAHSAAGELKRISIDGKAVKGSVTKMGPNPLQNVNVYDHESGLAIGQSPANNAGFGEIKGVLDIIDFLEIKKCLVSVDAANSCASVASGLKAKKADYLMPLRDTNTQYRAEAFEMFNTHHPLTTSQTDDTDHGRVEGRYAETMTVARMSDAFKSTYPSAKTIIRVIRGRDAADYRISTRTTKDGGEFIYERNLAERRVSVHEEYYFTSRKMTAEQALQAIRDHWQIENKLHWQLDVAFGEDQWTVRDRIAVRNLSILESVRFFV